MHDANMRLTADVAREPAGSRFERGTFYAVFGLLCTGTIVLLIAPTIIVLLTSVTDSQSIRFPPTGFSLQWYEALWTESPEIVTRAFCRSRWQLSPAHARCCLPAVRRLGWRVAREPGQGCWIRCSC